jgi:hypothetical protein
MKKLLLPMLTCLILAAPTLNAGWADWISNNMPQPLRVSKEYRDEVKYIQEKTGNPNVPIIFINGGVPNSLAGVWNFGLGSYQFSLMSIKQSSLQKQTPHLRTYALAHETAHIDKNHGAAANLGVIAVAVAPALARMIFFAPREGTSSAEREQQQFIQNVTVNALSFAALFGIMKWGVDHKKDEHEADAIAYEKLQKLGYCKALEHENEKYKSKLVSKRPDTRIRGENYPTLEEYAILTANALKKCGSGINPAERPDTPLLMRNGVPDSSKSQQQSKSTSWYDWFFGKRNT